MKKISRLNSKTIEDSTESEVIKDLVPYSSNKKEIIYENELGIKGEKNNDKVMDDEEVEEQEEESNFEKLYLDSIGIYTVLEYALLGSVRCLFRGPKEGLEDDSARRFQDKNANHDKNVNHDDNDIKTTSSFLPLSQPITPPLLVDNHCLYCGLAVLNNTRCARCKLPYCSRDHQRLHWNLHKVRAHALLLTAYFLSDQNFSLNLSCEPFLFPDFRSFISFFLFFSITHLFVKSSCH